MNGRLRSALIIGLQGIRARKLRTFLSMVSLFLGILAVVVVQAGASITERAMLADVELTSGYDGTKVLDVMPDEKSSGIVSETVAGRTDAVAMLTASAVIGEPNLSAIDPGWDGFEAMAESGGVATNCYDQVCPPSGQAIAVQLTALTGDVRQFRPYRQLSGAWLEWGTMSSMAPRIVLNREAAVGFGLYNVPAEMHVGGGDTGVTPRFIGVVDDGNPMATAYVRYDELAAWLPPRADNGLQVLVSPSSSIDQVLQKKLSAAGSDSSSYVIENRKDAEQMLLILRLVFLAMAGFVLLIGVAGILNVGLATVGERVEEFALRRAVGTPRALLAGIVLAETLITGLLTAAAAIGFGIGALKLVTVFLGNSEPFFRDLQFPWDAGIAGIVAGIVAGILGGFVPALRAARIPIATVMRA